MHSSLTIAAVMLAAAALTACGDGESVQFTQISAGEEHTCGLRTDGSVICWGERRQRPIGRASGRTFHCNHGWRGPHLRAARGWHLGLLGPRD